MAFLDVGDGTWTEALREAYADRIVARLGGSIANLDAAALERVVLSPVDLEALNPNLVGGDIYSGSCALDQNLLWRPLAEAPGHETPVPGVFIASMAQVYPEDRGTNYAIRDGRKVACMVDQWLRKT